MPHALAAEDSWASELPKPSKAHGVGVFMGVVLALAGNVAVNLGTVLMKRGGAQAEKPRTRRCGWWLGFLLWLFGNVLSFVSMSMVNLTLLAALQSVQFVSNVVFAWLLLGEVMSYRTVVGTVIIVSGNVLVALTAPSETPEFGILQLRDQWADSKYLAYVIMCLVICTMAQAFYCQRRRAGSHADNLAAISFALVSAPLGTQSNLQSKVFSTILSRLAVDGDRALLLQNRWFISLVILGWATTMVFWVYRLNMAIGIFPGFIIPVLQVFWMAFCILNGIFYFGEGSQMTSTEMACFLAGLAVLFLGVFVLASGQQTQLAESARDPEVQLVRAVCFQCTAQRGQEAGVCFLDHA